MFVYSANNSHCFISFISFSSIVLMSVRCLMYLSMEASNLGFSVILPIKEISSFSWSNSYYMYQSEWTNKSVLHLFPHWNWTVGQKIDMWAYYNNADEVELFINGKSQGRRHKAEHQYHVSWHCIYEPGTVRVVAYQKGIEEKKEPAKPLPPIPKPQVRKQPVVQPQPVLAVASPTAPSAFVVAAQPPAPAPQPIAAPPAPTPVAVVAARFDADYLHNPKPVYPALARRMGEEGKVLLKVRVSAQGTALEVAVAISSGFARLDAAASEAVARWRFVPARRGDEPVDSSVVVPITFALE